MSSYVEPWLRGTLTEVDPIRRQVLHALELAGEDISRWCADLTNEEMNARPFDLASVAFHLLHIARSLDRLLTYAETRQLSDEQMRALKQELNIAPVESVLSEVRSGLQTARERILSVSPADFELSRGVGRAMLPSTVGGLLVHCAEHTQRHVGQAVTTAKVVRKMRQSP